MRNKIINWFKSLFNSNEMYKDALEFQRLKTWFTTDVIDISNGCVKIPISKRAYKVFNLPYDTISNSIVGYVESKKCNFQELKDTADSRFEIGNPIYYLVDKTPGNETVNTFADGIYKHNGKFAVIVSGTLVYYK